MNTKQERVVAVRLVSKRRWQEDALSYSAAIIAVVALGVSIWQGYLTRHQNRLSVRPLLFAFADFTRGQKESGLILTNRGYGPALLNESSVYLEGEAKRAMTRETWQEVMRSGGMSVVVPQSPGIWNLDSCWRQVILCN